MKVTNTSPPVPSRKIVAVIVKGGSLYLAGNNSIYFLSNIRETIEASGYSSLKHALEREGGEAIYEGDTVTLQF